MPTTLQAREWKKLRKAVSMQDLDKAYEAAISSHHGPKYTLRARVEFGAQIRKNMSENSLTSGPINVNPVKHENPRWTIRARTCKMLQLPGMTMDSVPGPGTYPVPTTVYLDHPCMKMPGRTKFATAPRFPEFED